MEFPAYKLEKIPVTQAMIDAIGATPSEAYMGRDLLCVFDDEKTVRNLQPDMNKLLNLDGLRMCTLIFWMMTEGKMQSFLKKHFMRKRIWIHRCMYSRKIIMQLLLMKSIRNFWQKYWQIQICGRCSIRWQRRWSNKFYIYMSIFIVHVENLSPSFIIKMKEINSKWRRFP